MIIGVMMRLGQKMNYSSFFLHRLILSIVYT